MYAEDRGGCVRFHQVPPPIDAEVARVAERVHRRVVRLLERSGMQAHTDGDDLDNLQNSQLLLPSEEVYPKVPMVSLQHRLSAGHLHATCLRQTGAGRSHHGAGKDPRQACLQGVQVKEKDCSDLIKSVKQAGRIRRGQIRAARIFTFRPADIMSIRLNLGKSQSEFALMIGVSVATLQNWEGRRVGCRHPGSLLQLAALCGERNHSPRCFHGCRQKGRF